MILLPMQQPRYHIICDISNCNEKINDPKEIRVFLESVVKIIDMKILEGPIVSEGFPSDPGLSAVVLVDYSHISIHTFTKYDEALIDVFSCRPFERNPLVDFACEYFGAKREESRIKEVWWG